MSKLTYQEIISIPNIKNTFLSKVIITSESECWIWKLKPDGRGYGKTILCVSKIRCDISAHRLSYFIFNGDIKSGLVVRHTCHNGMCVNPKHLILGTYQDNSNDTANSGRAFSKLTKEDVLAIIIRIKNGEECSVISRDYLVNESTIGDIKRGRTWKHLTGGKVIDEYPSFHFSQTEKIAYEKGYRANEDGIIYNPQGKQVNGWIDNRGYMKFGIRKSKNKDVQIQVHRFQAYQLFGDKIYEPYIIVRHINGDPLDNAFNNLELGTKTQNRMDMPPEDRVKYSKIANQSKQKLTMEQLKNFWIDVFNGWGCRKLANKYDITDSTALGIINGKNYKEESEQAKKELAHFISP